MNSPRILYILMLVSCLFLASCSGRGRLILQAPKNTIQLSSGATTGIVSRLKSDGLPQSMRAMLNIDIQSGAGKDSFRQALVFKKPELFRLEAFATGVNALVFIATSDGHQFKAVLPTDKKVLIGTPSARSLASLIQLPLTPLEMVSLISGKIFPEFLDSSKLNISKASDGSIFLTSLSANNRELRVKMDNENSLRILELSLSDDGSGALNAKCNYQVGVLRSLKVLLPEIVANVEIEELHTNVNISSDKVFSVSQPASYTVERAD